MQTSGLAPLAAPATLVNLEQEREVDVTAAFDHVFGTRHAVIEEQRQEFLAETGAEVARG